MGGRAVMEKYGSEHFSKLGKKAVASLLLKFGPDYFKDRARSMNEAKKSQKTV